MGTGFEFICLFAYGILGTSAFLFLAAVICKSIERIKRNYERKTD